MNINVLTGVWHIHICIMYLSPTHICSCIWIIKNNITSGKRNYNDMPTQHFKLWQICEIWLTEPKKWITILLILNMSKYIPATNIGNTVFYANCVSVGATGKAVHGYPSRKHLLSSLIFNDQIYFSPVFCRLRPKTSVSMDDI